MNNREKHLVRQIMLNPVLQVNGDCIQLDIATFQRHGVFTRGGWDGTWDLRLGLKAGQTPQSLPEGVQAEIRREYDCVADNYECYALVLRDVKPPIVEPNKRLRRCIVKWSQDKGYRFALTQERETPELADQRRAASIDRWKNLQHQTTETP